MLMATRAWSTSPLLLFLLRRSWLRPCAAWRINKEAPSANGLVAQAPIRRAPGCLWAKAVRAAVDTWSRGPAWIVFAL